MSSKKEPLSREQMLRHMAEQILSQPKSISLWGWIWGESEEEPDGEELDLRVEALYQRLSPACMGYQSEERLKWDRGLEEELNKAGKNQPVLGGTFDLEQQGYPIWRAQERDWLARVYDWCPDSMEGLHGMDRSFDDHLLCAAEVLSLESAYHDLGKDKIRSLWVGGELRSYQVTVIPLVGGIEAYGLTPISLTGEDVPLDVPALLLFKGTSTDTASKGSGFTVTLDLDWDGVAKNFYDLEVHQQARQFMKQMAELGFKVVTCGHSMGGALATYTGIYNPDLVTKVYTFNPPAVARSAEVEYKRLKNEENKGQVRVPLIWNFINTLDPVPYTGQEAVGQDFFVQPCEEFIDECHQRVASMGDYVFRWICGFPLHTSKVHGRMMFGRPHILIKGRRELSKWRGLLLIGQLILWPSVSLLVGIKRIIIGHRSATSLSYAVSWVHKLLDGIAGLILTLLEALIRLLPQRFIGPAEPTQASPQSDANIS
ncbi:MAG: lipase family protein [Chlamydiia bacterium]